MSNTNDIIDQIEVKVNEAIKYLRANDKHFHEESIVVFIDSIKDAFKDFKSEEYDTREEWEIEADAHSSRMCDEFHASRDNKLTR